MLREFMIYARGLGDWPQDIFKDVACNKYRGSGRKGNGRKKKKNMNRVSRSTKRKHNRRA